MTQTYEAYNSKVHVLEIDSIPETGDEAFSVGSHPIIVWNSQIDVQNELVADWRPNEPGSRGAIGVLGTKTVLVDVEYNKDSRGLTIRELAQFMLNVLGCKTASATLWEPIIAYTGLVEEDEEVPTLTDFGVKNDESLLPGGGEIKTLIPPKRKKKGDSSERKE